ncbi:MAG: hypothetical protein ABI461_07395, partial [Polyangiaceae bacterium]
VYLTAAVAITPIFQALSHNAAWSIAPIAFALALVGVVGNASAIRRLSVVARVLRERQNPRAVEREQEIARAESSNAELHRLVR